MNRINALSHPLAAIALHRLWQAVAVALIVGTLTFFLTRLLPGDMAFRVAASRYGYDLVNAAAAEAVRAELGLDRPLWLALAAWWGDLARLNLGTSLVSGESVLSELAHEMGHTVQLSVVALLLSAVMGVPLGLLAGLRPGGALDRITLALAVLLRALPPFVLGLLLILLLAIQMSSLPAAGHGEPGNLMLPALTLALPLAALSCRVARDAMVSVAGSAHFAFALTKGLSAPQALLRHGLRNVGVPLVAYLGVQMVMLVEGVVVVETLFARPGIGHALVHAIFGRDVPMIQGAALAMGLLFVLFNTLVDVACQAIDPRRRVAG